MWSDAATSLTVVLLTLAFGRYSLPINNLSIDLEATVHQHFDDELVLIWSLACGESIPESELTSTLYGDGTASRSEVPASSATR